MPNENRDLSQRDLSQPGSFLRDARMFFRYAPELVLAKEIPEPYRSALLEVYPDHALEQEPAACQADGLLDGMEAPEGYLEACAALLKLMKEAPDSWLAKFVKVALTSFKKDPDTTLRDTTYFTRIDDDAPYLGPSRQ